MTRFTKSDVEEIYNIQGTMEVRATSGRVTLSDIPGFGACDVCGKIEPLPFRCDKCWGVYCLEHHMPWNHNCDQVKQKKREEAERRARVDEEIRKNGTLVITKEQEDGMIQKMNNYGKEHYPHYEPTPTRSETEAIEEYNRRYGFREKKAKANTEEKGIIAWLKRLFR